MFDPIPHQSKVPSLSIYQGYACCNLVDEILQEDSTWILFLLHEATFNVESIILWSLRYIKLVVRHDLLIDESVLNVLMGQ